MIETIQKYSWDNLVAANEAAVAAGWAARGVFATGVGPDYVPGAPASILYVGKSAGPLGAKVGSTATFATSAAASTRWMVDRVNKSAFWQMIDKIDHSRRSIAWTNICKMDRIGGGTPPSYSEWAQVKTACEQALIDEITVLQPQTLLFATSAYLKDDVRKLLIDIGYDVSLGAPNDGWTTALGHANGSRAVLTKHPQGWSSASRNAVISFIGSQNA